MEDYVSAREAAKELGLTYHALLARVRKGQIKAERVGWAVLIHQDEVKRVRDLNDNHAGLASSAR